MRCARSSWPIASPETVGPPADVYAVGCVAYFLLTSHAPFEGKSLVQVCASHMHAAPKPPSTYVSHVPSELDALVLRCLEKKPERRPSTYELEALFAR